LQPELLTNSSHFSVPPRFKEFSVVTRTLDSYAFDGVAFIKMDVEGHEEAVLYGSKETIMRSRPIVLLEVRFAARAAVAHFFSNLDYRMFFLSANTLHEVGKNVSELESGQENFFAVPSEKASNVES
jgi:hypothetical protein